ncbi:MAG: UDP-N-acetylmuramoyl-L-alanine--D-glutamate ligase, partial [Ignavibacteriales bacterium]|nr:UDP-N-acetylmuramoyl-L-alanine--D-glutamate ligase [Ignavibacteriales bacterium]
MKNKEFYTSIEDKNVTVLGAERSGLGAAKLLQKLGAIPFVSDMADEEKIADRVAELQSLGIAYECGGHTSRVHDAEFIICSPGVPSDALPLIQAAEKGIPVIGEIEFASFFCKGTIIGITGTNGKSTTTALIHHLLNTAGLYSVAAGNIGRAFSEVALEIPEDGFVSLEISSFQLDHIQLFKPHVGIILNITPDHLNRYSQNIELYAQAKFNLFKNFTAENLLILNYDNSFLGSDKINATGMVHYFSLHEQLKTGIAKFGDEIIASIDGKETFRCNVSDIYIRGEHNHANAMAAIAAVLPYIKKAEDIKRGLLSFTGIEHRLELVREIDGVQYINDSKATNVDSVWYALRTFSTPIFLILGGIDKGNDYGQIKDLVLEKVVKIYA